nr:DUF2970 domain-containing protein [uncultured Caldimonas sp.]
MKPLAYVRMVLWSFFGVRQRAGAGEELAQAKPGVLLATAVAAAAAFGFCLWGLVHLAISVLQ